MTTRVSVRNPNLSLLSTAAAVLTVALGCTSAVVPTATNTSAASVARPSATSVSNASAAARPTPTTTVTQTASKNKTPNPVRAANLVIVGRIVTMNEPVVADALLIRDGV